jgi:hypothetical protein
MTSTSLNASNDASCLDIVATACAAALLATWAPTHAALPSGTLEWVDRTGTALPTDAIGVQLRFTLDPNGAPLDFKSDPLRGFDPADLPTHGLRWNPDTGQFDSVRFASVQRAQLQSWFVCATNFFDGCGTGGAYSWAFDPVAGAPAGQYEASWKPGETREFELIRLTPNGVGAPPGTYRLGTVGFQLSFFGLDHDGLALGFTHALASLCDTGDAGCAFTRVVAVPEPGTWALLALGLGTVAARARRSSAAKRASAGPR